MRPKEIEIILTELSRASGVSGNEEQPVAIASRYLQPYVSSLKKDYLGNLIAFKKGSGREEKPPSLMLAAHIDEIGAMVAKIETGGFLRFTAVGGFDPRVLPGQIVELHSVATRLKGLIGARPPHLLTEQERRKELKIEDMFIDLGLPEEQVRRMVKPGDYISLDQQPLVMASGNCMAGKSMDNRAGVAALIACAAELAGVTDHCDLYFVATVQEEVGLRGAITAAYGIVPDLAVAIDVTHGESPGLSVEETFELGAGPAIAVGPNIHPALGQILQELARDHRIPYQLEPAPGLTGTDARALQVSREGIPSAVLSIPLRYMHTTVEMLSLDDLHLAGRLLACLARSLDRSFMEGLRCI